MTYIISANINNYTLALINLLSLWNIKLLNHSPAILVVIGRAVYGMANIVPSHFRYKIYTYVYVWNCNPSLPVDWPKGKATCFFYLGKMPSMITTSCNQTSKSIRNKSTNKYENYLTNTKVRQFKYVNSVCTVPCMNNILICGIIILPVDKRSIV